MWYNLLNSAQTAQEKRKGYSMKIVLVGGGKVGTVGYQIVDSIHCSQIARNPVRAP